MQLPFFKGIEKILLKFIKMNYDDVPISEMEKNMWRIILILFPLLPFLVACGADPASPQPTAETISLAIATEIVEIESENNNERVPLRVTWWGSQNRHERTIAAIELFEEKYPQIDVLYEFDNGSDYWKGVDQQSANDNLPDVMQQDYARLTEWVANEHLLMLDSFVESGRLNFEHVSDDELDSGRIDGQLYAVCLGTNSQTFVLDVDAFDEAGIPLPDQDWTWDEFEQIVIQLHQATDKWGMGPGLSSEQLWKSLYMGHGQWAYNAEGTGLGYTDDSILATYLEMVRRLQDTGAIPTLEDEKTRFDKQGVEAEPIVTGEAAMAYIWSNQIVAVQSAAGEERNFQMIHLPRPEGGEPSNYVKPAMFFSITATAKQPEEAALFIDFFTNDAEANKILLAERGVPISSEVRRVLDPFLGKAQSTMFEYMNRVLDDNSPTQPPDPSLHGTIRDKIYAKQVIEPFLYGQVGATEAVQILRLEAEQIFAANAE